MNDHLPRSVGGFKRNRRAGVAYMYLALENVRRRVGYHRLGSIAKMALDGKEL